MAHEIAAVCTCRLCSLKLIGPTALALGSGLSLENQRVAQFAMRLAEHILKQHPEENKACEVKALEFLGMLRLANFQTNDKGILEQRDYLRWRVHQATLNGALSDEKLEEAAAAFAGKVVDMCIANLILLKPGEQPPAHVEHVAVKLRAEASVEMKQILVELREIIQEPGRYLETAAGTAPASPKLVVPGVN